jgi:hypothetical protein
VRKEAWTYCYTETILLIRDLWELNVVKKGQRKYLWPCIDALIWFDMCTVIMWDWVPWRCAWILVVGNVTTKKKKIEPSIHYANAQETATSFLKGAQNITL